MVKITGAQILEAVAGTVVRGNHDGLSIAKLSEPLEANAGSVSFLISNAYVKDSASCHSTILVVQENLWEFVSKLIPDDVDLVIKSPDAYLGLAKVTEIYATQDPLLDWSFETSIEGMIQDSSTLGFIHPSAKIDPTAKIAPGAVVCAAAVVGPRTVIMPHAVVGPAATIGAQCVLFPGTVLYPRTVLGDRVRLHANVVLGADGFGYARGPRGSVKIWHLGRVVVGNDVEIGANTCIDRGTLRDTIVEDSVKVDNLVQVGHNGHLKAHSILCAQTGLAGNVTVGRGTILAGQAGVADKVVIGDAAIIGPQAGVSKDVVNGTTLLGTLVAKPRREWWRLNAFFDRLPELFDRVKKLESQK